MNVTLQLFGPFRTMGHTADVSLPDGATTLDLAKAVEAFLSAQAREDLIPTLHVSRFATDKFVLPKGAPLGDLRHFAIIPPVSGG